MYSQNNESMPGEPQKIREPILAGVLSFFCLGLGQAYNGQRRKGYIYFSGLIVVMIFYFILNRLFNEPLPERGEKVNLSSPSYMIATIGYLFLWILNIYDAYQTANRINSNEIVIGIDSTVGKSVLIFLRNIVLGIICFILLIPFSAILIRMLARLAK